MGWACRSPRIGRIICRGRCRRRFGRSWAKALTKKGKFVFLVNEALIWLSPQEPREAVEPLFSGSFALFVNAEAAGAGSYCFPSASQEDAMKARLDTKTVPGLAVPPGRHEDFVWDTDLEGFGLRLRRGVERLRRTYVAQYRAKGRTRRVTIGTAERLTPAQAREGDRKVLARVSLGEDPQDAKAAQRTAAERPFRKVVDAYLASKRGGLKPLRPASYKVTKLYLTGPYFRPLHARGIGEIEHPDIAARLSTITRAHSANTAAAARRHLSALLPWAMEEGWPKQNPVVGTRKPAKAKARDRLLPDAELVAIWNACGDDDFGRIVRLLILLGSRPQEIGGMRTGE